MRGGGKGRLEFFQKFIRFGSRTLPLLSLSLMSPGDPLTKLRCDGRVDCEDKSDEEDCGRAVIDSSYNKAMTPQPLSGKYNK